MAIQKAGSFRMADFSSGLLDDVSVSRYLLPDNAVFKSINCIFSRPRGSISQRLGTTLIGNAVSAGNTCLGLHNFISSDSSNNKLLSVFNGVIYSYDSNWGSSLTGLNTSAKVSFLTYLDRVVFLNGVNQAKSWDGNAGSWLTTGGSLDVANFPITKFATILNTRVLAAGNTSYPDTVYLSSLEASNAISWTSGNKSFRVNPNDGAGNITGVTGNGRIALIFKQRGLYRYDDVELQRIGFVGTPSHESIVTDDGGFTYFFGQGANGVGFYQTDGGRPLKISRPVTKAVEAIDPAFYSKVAGYVDGEKVQWSIGSITLDGLTYTNASLVYFPSDRTWSIFNHSDRFRVFSQYIDSSGYMRVAGGDTDGAVQKINSGYTDNGDPISSECEFKPTVITTEARIKTINEIFALATHYQGLQLHLKTDNDSFVLLGDIKENVNQFKKFINQRGHKFQFKITAINNGEPFQFDGLEIPEGGVYDEGY